MTIARGRLTERQKDLLHQEHDGRCYLCGGKVGRGEAEWDHRLPVWISGDNALSNFAPAHPQCHRDKTAKHDVPAIAKVKRIIARLTGTRRPRKPIPQRLNPWPPPGSRKLPSRPLR